MYSFIYSFVYLFFSVSQGIKHAVVRKDLKIKKNSEITENIETVKTETENSETENYSSINSEYTVSNVHVFRCGKVGPCNSLGEVLR